MQNQEQVKAIGFRVEKDAIYWSVVAGTKRAPTLLAHRKMNTPEIYKNEEAAKLDWLRGRLSDVLSEHQPRSAMVRYPEPTSRSTTNSTRERSRIEGIVLQLLYEQRIKIVAGALSTIASNVSIALKSIKHEMTNENFRGLDWSRYTPVAKESIIAAVAALEE